MTIWQLLTHFWLHHDILFTKFGSFDVWVKWNLHHFRCVPGIKHWHGWHQLWAWVNIHG